MEKNNITSLIVERMSFLFIIFTLIGVLFFSSLKTYRTQNEQQLQHEEYRAQVENEKQEFFRALSKEKTWCNAALNNQKGK